MVDILVIWPIYIPLPLFFTRLKKRFLPSKTSDDLAKETGPARRMYSKLGLETAPVIGVLLLLASTCIPGSVVRDGIVGSEGVRPYDIMTLFLSFVSPLYSSILRFSIPSLNFRVTLLRFDHTSHPDQADARPISQYPSTVPVYSNT